MHHAIFNVRITFIGGQGGWGRRRLSVGSECETDEQSINDLEREQHSKGGTYLTKIYGTQQQIPCQLKKFLSAGRNKKELLKVASYSYLKFWVFYATFGLAKFTTKTLKTRQSDYFEDTHNVLNYLCVKDIIQF